MVFSVVEVESLPLVKDEPTELALQGESLRVQLTGHLMLQPVSPLLEGLMAESALVLS